MKTKLAVGITFISLVILVLIIIFKSVPKTVEVTTFRKSYNFVDSSPAENVEIPLYFSLEDSYLANSTNITSSYLKSKEEQIKLDLIKITKTNQFLKLKNKEFYKTNFYFRPNLELESNFKFEFSDAYLLINYIQGLQVEIDLGSFSYYYFSDNSSNFRVSTLKGLVNELDYKTLVGIGLTLKNNASEEIKIKEIKALDVNLEVANSDVIELANFSQGEEISNILGYSYDPYSYFSNDEVNLTFNEELKLFIPLKYKQKLLTTNLGFEIIYEVNGEEKSFWMDDFKFFETKLYEISEINSLKYYLYENY